MRIGWRLLVWCLAIALPPLPAGAFWLVRRGYFG